MKAEYDVHEHKFSGQLKTGHLLEPGDVLEPDDVYDSTNGKWEKCPCPGLTLQRGNTAIWVRPLSAVKASRA